MTWSSFQEAWGLRSIFAHSHMSIGRPPCLTSAYHSLSKWGPPTRVMTLQTIHTRCATLWTFKFGFGEIHCKTNWNTNFLCQQIWKPLHRVSSKTKPYITWNPPCCIFPSEQFRHHFPRNCLWRLFYGFRPSRKCWLLVSERAAKPNRGRDQARASPRQPSPSPQSTLLQSSLQFGKIHWAFLTNTFCVYTNTFVIWENNCRANPVVFDKNTVYGNREIRFAE